MNKILFAQMIFHLSSSTGEKFDLVCNEDNEFDSFLAAFKEKTGIDLENVQFYQNKKLITRKTKLNPNSDGSISLSYINIYECPILAFPQSEFQFPYDIPLFSKQDVDELYPSDTKSEREKKPTNKSNLTSIQKLFPTMRFEYTDPSVAKPTFPLLNRALKGGKFVDVPCRQEDLEEDEEIAAQIDRSEKPLNINQMANSLTPDEQCSVQRLCNFGYDRDFILDIFFHTGRNEEYALSFLSQVFGT